MMNKLGFMLCGVLVLGGVACSSSDTGGSSGGSGGTTTGSSGGTTGSTVNGCSASTAEDHTSGGAVTINFGGSQGLKYAPACIKVTAGTAVTFAGDFSTHPLTPGVDCTPNANGAQLPATTNTGTSQTFTLSTAGTVPYFCAAHCSTNAMKGAIFVQ